MWFTYFVIEIRFLIVTSTSKRVRSYASTKQTLASITTCTRSCLI